MTRFLPGWLLVGFLGAGAGVFAAAAGVSLGVFLFLWLPVLVVMGAAGTASFIRAEEATEGETGDY